MHNGQGSGDTESGAYTLVGGTPTPNSSGGILRNPDAVWWLPTHDEWYKAAYYDPIGQSYFQYPTGTDAAPNNNIPANDTGNSANHYTDHLTAHPDYPTTDAGAYKLSKSVYGTFDQGGNVREWTETLLGGAERIYRGGAWNDDEYYLRATSALNVELPWNSDQLLGFRLATVAVPEPAAFLLVMTAPMIAVCRPRLHASRKVSG